MYEYLDKLSLSEDDKDKIKGLTAETPAALLSLIKTSPQDFKNYLGEEKTAEIISSLDTLISQKDRQVLDFHLDENRGLGAVAGKSPEKLNPPDFDIEERDRLFEKLKYWQSQDSSSDFVKNKIDSLTDRLNALFKNQA